MKNFIILAPFKLKYGYQKFIKGNIRKEVFKQNNKL